MLSNGSISLLGSKVGRELTKGGCRDGITVDSRGEGGLIPESTRSLVGTPGVDLELTRQGLSDDSDMIVSGSGCYTNC